MLAATAVLTITTGRLLDEGHVALSEMSRTPVLVSGTAGWNLPPLSTVHPSTEPPRLLADEPEDGEEQAAPPENDGGGLVSAEGVGALQPDDTAYVEVQPSVGQGLTDAEAVICTHFPEDCAHALRVFACESGPDYVDGNPYDRYAGAAQIDVHLHSWRFMDDPYDLSENMRVARQIHDEVGWQAWPVCRWS